jgi:hypothetical protein
MRSAARVMVPLVENDLHFRVIRRTRTIRASTLNRFDQ